MIRVFLCPACAGEIIAKRPIDGLVHVQDSDYCCIHHAAVWGLQ